MALKIFKHSFIDALKERLSKNDIDEGYLKGGISCNSTDTMTNSLLQDPKELQLIMPGEDSDFEFFGESNYAYEEDNTLIFEVLSTSDGVNIYSGTSIKITDTAGLLTPQTVSLAKETGKDKSETIIIGDSGLSFRFTG